MSIPPTPQHPEPRLPDVAPPMKMPVWGWWLVGCLGGPMLCLLILAALLFPQAWEAARAASCLACQKQMGNAISMYSQDYDQQFPPAAHWQSSIFPYTKSTLIFICPSTKAMHTAYAFNNRLGKMKTTDIASPTSTVAVFETTQDQKDAHGGPEILVTPGRHRWGNDFVFGDGHARWFPDSNRLNFNPAVNAPKPDAPQQ